MKITKLELQSFGKFSQTTLTFQDGLNLIYGPNEAGKTTLMAFINLMFYSDQGRASRYHPSLRQRYRPWQGEEMAGAITFYSQQHEIRIQKQFKSSHKTDIITIFDHTAGRPIVLAPNEEAGEYFFKLTRLEFNKVLFFSTTDAEAIDRHDTLTDKLMQQLKPTHAPEDSSAQQAILRLQDAETDLISKSGRQGRLRQLEQRDQELTVMRQQLVSQLKQQQTLLADLTTIRTKLNEQDKINQQLSALQQQQQHYAAQLWWRKYQQQQAISAPLLKHYSWSQWQEALPKLQALADQEPKQMPSSSIDTVLKCLKNQILPLMTPIHVTFKGLVQVAALGLALIALVMTKQWVLAALALTLAGGGWWYMYPYFQARAWKQCQQLWQPYASDWGPLPQTAAGVQHLITHLQLKQSAIIPEEQSTDFVRAMEQFTQQTVTREQAVQQLSVWQQQFQYYQQLAQEQQDLQKHYGLPTSLVAIKSLAQQPLDFSETEIESQLTALTHQQHDLAQQRLAEQAFTLQQQLHLPSESLDQLDQQQTTLRQQLQRQQTYYKALKLAENSLKEAMVTFQQQVLPTLTTKMSHYLAIITQQRYQAVRISTDYQLAVKQGLAYRDVMTLSSGTRDQVYLALRFALADILENETTLPRFLDDSLMQYDDHRLQAVLLVLAQVSSNHQVLVFTCHETVVHRGQAAGGQVVKLETQLN